MSAIKQFVTNWKDVLQAGSLVIGVIVAAFAYFNYRNNLRLERTKWAAKLYEKFYEASPESKLREVREYLDCGPEGSEKLSQLVDSEDPTFTDYLNFFELVSYLEKSKQL